MTAFLKTNKGKVAAPFDNPAWQAEIADFHRNHFLIELMLCQPGRLSPETTRQCRYLQRVMVTTIEQFLKDMDELEAQHTLHNPCARKVLMKHTNTLSQLNQLVRDVLNEQPSIAQA